MKVQDLAYTLGKPTKDFIRFLSEVDIKVKSGNTRLAPEVVDQIKELFKGESKEAASDEKAPLKQITLNASHITVSALAELLGVRLSEILKMALGKGLLLNLNSDINFNTAKELAETLGFAVSMDDATQEKPADTGIRDQFEKIQAMEIGGDLGKLIERAAVITIMGHVDHGKTLLLDSLRKSNIVAQEAGGITQHIGAYQIEVKGKKLTFLDTPGHAAFTALRARGAQVTDIVILVVAADEGVKPQTVEAIHHAKAAEVPIIVAVNKIDKPDANLDRIKQQLAEHELVAEDWGGKTVMVPISAKTQQGFPELLDMILLTAEMLELKANASGPAQGVVIESRLSRKRGPIATILIKTGTLRVGDHFVIDTFTGKVRALLNDLGKNITEAPPGMPVEILGIDEVPKPGSFLEVLSSEKEGKVLTQRRITEEALSSAKKGSGLTLESLSRQVKEGATKTLNLIIKGDVHGSVEAITAAIGAVDKEDVVIQIVHAATGPVNENDVMLAMASGSLIMAFNVGVLGEAETLAATEKISIKPYRIIYEMIDDIQAAVHGMFTPVYEEVETATIEVRQLFSFSKIGVIAGSHVLTGKVTRNTPARVFRDGKEVFAGKIASLKRFKEDVKEVATGFECGVVMDKFNDLQVGDIIRCFETREKK